MRKGAPHILGYPYYFTGSLGLDCIKNRVHGGDNVRQFRVTLQLGELTKICQRASGIIQLSTEVNALPGVINEAYLCDMLGLGRVTVRKVSINVSHVLNPY